jgi:chromosome partitioning protein
LEVWAIANQKGGVGKTTTTVSLAGLLSKRGMRTLLIDLDPHGSLTAYFGWNPDALQDSVYGLFQRSTGSAQMPLATVLKKTALPEVNLLPASSTLATLDRQIAGKDGMGLVLAETLRDCATRFEHVLIDCPPVFGVLMLNALAACRLLIIPVQTEFLALKGLERMCHTLTMVARAQKREVDYVVLPTLYDQRTRACRESLQSLRKHYLGRLWNGLIPVDTRFRDASRAGVPLTVNAPGARGSKGYEAFLGFLLQRDGSTCALSA